MDELHQDRSQPLETDDGSHLHDGSIREASPRIPGQLARLEQHRSVLAACGVHVIDEDLAQIACPGACRHTTQEGPKDCVVYDNGSVLRATCFHTSCRDEIDALNRRFYRLRRRLSQAASGCEAITSYQRSTWHEKQKKRKGLEQRAADIRPHILEKYHWPADSIAAASPVAINLPVERQHRYIFDLFNDDDVLWCAPSVKCTGARWHDKYFHKAARWAREYKCPGAFICPNTFEAGTFSRSDANIARRRFLVVESDTLSRDQVGAVFKWMIVCLGMSLRAVVNTGGRSLHAWFTYPSEGLPEKLRIILEGLGCEPAMFRPAQPCRLPGVRRPDTGCWQELLYLAPPSPHATNTNADGLPLGDTVAI